MTDHADHADQANQVDDDTVQVHYPDNVTNAQPGQIVRAFRLIEYCGPKEWVVEQILRSIHGRKVLLPDRWIEGKTIYSEVDYYTELDVCVDQIRKALARDDGRPRT